MCATKKHFLFVLGWLCFACIAELTIRAQEQTKDSSKLAIFGSGHGLDHVGIAVRDLAAAKKTYRDILGFKVFGGGRLPVGTRNEIVFLESGIFEIITSSDPTKSDGRAVASFLEKHEGGLFLGLEATPVEDTAKLLRKRGYDIQGPTAGRMDDDPEQPDHPPFWGTWHLAGFATGPVPAGHLPARSTDAIFFVEYDPFIGAVHPNTAKKLASVWMGVRDLEASVRAYESIGFRRSRKVAVPQLGANGQEIEAGQGPILLLQPQNMTGTVSSFLAERDAEGIMGVSVEVGNLRTARSLLESNTKRQFQPYAGLYGQSILIPPEFTHGIWIEFFQK